jgi:RNA polymerase sigma-70 factor (ECF subfamily)
MKRATTDAEATFRDLYEAVYDDLLSFVERRTQLSVADDVVAETFLIAWRRLEDVPDPLDEARAWLFTVAHNTLRNRQRSEQRQEKLALRILREPGHSETIDDEALAATIDMARAWKRLTPADQEVLTLIAIEDLTGPQAARVLGISRPALSLRLLRARRRLRQHLLQRPEAAAAPPPSPVPTTSPGGSA